MKPLLLLACVVPTLAAPLLPLALLDDPAAADAPASVADAASVDASSPASAEDEHPLRLRVHNKGQTATVLLRLYGPTGVPVAQEVATLPARGTHELVAQVEPGRHRGELQHLLVQGSSPFDTSACGASGAVIVMNVTFDGLSASLSVVGGSCAPEPAATAQRAVHRVHAAASVPAPTCPTQCAMAYGVAEATRFSVDGPARVEVVATWSPTTPAARDLVVALSKGTAGCDACRAGVATARGSGQAVLVYEAKEAADLFFDAWPAGPVGAAFSQDVHLEVRVRPS